MRLLIRIKLRIEDSIEGFTVSLWVGLPVTHEPHSSGREQDGICHFEGSGDVLFRTTRNPAAWRTPKKVKPETVACKIFDGTITSKATERASKLNCFCRHSLPVKCHY